MKYTLEPYNGIKTRYKCPQCKNKQTFTRYIDIETNNYIDESVGRCNKENSCNYHKSPKKFFSENKLNIICTPYFKKDQHQNSKPDYINEKVLLSSLKDYDANNFVSFLNKCFEKDVVQNLIEKYYIGTSDYWKGSTIFWQIDEVNKIRTGKVMLYDPLIGKRVKKPINKIHWIHSILKIDEYNLKQTFFGMHLTKETTKTIAIVESEKTAIICSVFFPDYIWLATGGLNNLKAENMKPLKNRNVVLFPDIGAFEKWNHIAKEFSTFCNIKVSNTLEIKAKQTNTENGYDLADYLLQDFNYI